MEPRRKEGRDRRRSGMDLEHRRSTVSGAIQIVDLYHARQHLWDLARKLYLNQEAEQRRWMMVHQDMLDNGDVENLVVALRSIDSSNPELAEAIRTTANYFETNTSRMRYPEFCSQHLFVGSGVIEAGSTGPGSVPAASSRACSGPYTRRTPSWLCDAVTSMAALKTLGRRAGLDLHFYVAHPWREGVRPRRTPDRPTCDRHSAANACPRGWRECVGTFVPSPFIHGRSRMRYVASRIMWCPAENPNGIKTSVDLNAT